MTNIAVVSSKTIYFHPLLWDNGSAITQCNSFSISVRGGGNILRRSLRKIDTREVQDYAETDQIFTVMSLEEARQRLAKDGHDPSVFCFFTWMREGVRYYRVWEDKKLKEGIVRAVPFGQAAARLKRADAEKLYTVAKRYTGALIRFDVSDGLVRVAEATTGDIRAGISVPLVGGTLVFEPQTWTERQAAHFVNVVLVRGQSPDVAFQEADSFTVTSKR